MKNIKNIIVFDTEFVSFKTKGQPIQVAFTAYEIKDAKLKFVSDFSCYIKLQKGISLNQYVVKYTGIDNEKLLKEGITLKMAQDQLIDYLLSFPLDKTILLGWDVTNDLIMFNKLFNFEDEVIDISSFRWADLSKTFTTLNKLDHSYKLKDACDYYQLEEKGYHNALSDVSITTSLLEKMIQVHGLEGLLCPLIEVKGKKKSKN